MTSRTVSSVALSCALALVASFGCDTMEVMEPETIEATYENHTGRGTPELWAGVWRAVLGDRKHRVRLLNEGQEALLARINLIRSARKSIRIQTFIWTNDECGRLVMWELIKAVKQRGVEVEIVADHLFSDQDPATLAYLTTLDPRLKIRLYNPAAERLEPSFRDLLGAAIRDFSKVNLRMHNKIMLVDDRYAIVGGRNIANEYYDRVVGLNFKDREVIVVGPVAAEMRKSFEEFAGFQWTVPASDLVDVKALVGSGEYPRWKTGTDFAFYHLFPDIPRLVDDPVAIKETLTSSLLPVNEVSFVGDRPEKTVEQELVTTSRVTDTILKLISESRESILIQSPYLALSESAVERFKELRDGDSPPRVIISTNSLAATDSWMTYAVSYKQKRIYLEELGFTIFEFMPVPQDIHEMMRYGPLLTRRPTPWERETLVEENFDLDAELKPFEVVDEMGETVLVEDRCNQHTGTLPYLCLHQKSFVIDTKVSFVGSYNLDPRSIAINTESGVVIHDEAFARALTADIRRDTAPQNSFLIARRRGPWLSRTINELIQDFSEDRSIDAWPFRHTSSFRLRGDKPPVDPEHPDFYSNWEDVGSFPLLDFFTKKEIMARMFKLFGRRLIPLV